MARARPIIGLTTLLASITLTTPAYAAIPLQDETGTATKDQIQKITEAYDQIPEQVRGLYESRGNRIVIVDGSEDTNWLGQYDGEDGKNATITVTNIGYGGAESVVHEMGHFIDDVTKEDEEQARYTYTYKGFQFTSGGGAYRNYGSISNEFAKIYHREQSAAPVTDYEKSTQSEYFAGAFRVYCLQPTTLQEYAPMTYKYIDNIIQEVTKK